MAKKKLPQWALEEAKLLLKDRDPVQVLAEVLIQRESDRRALPKQVGAAFRTEDPATILGSLFELGAAIVGGMTDNGGVESPVPGEGKLTLVRGGK